jgi:outer membrane cobalamin receptor
MRVSVVFLSLLLSASAFAADLTIKVLDPQSSGVSGAQVSLLCGSDHKNVVTMQTTSAEGTVTLPKQEGCEIRVLAAGFAREFIDALEKSDLTVRLRLAPSSQTVVVTATRTPVSADESGADVDVLNGAQLMTTRPTSAADAVRFLSGAIVNDAGERGGLTSLFVRGGESRYNKVIVDGVVINEPGGTFDFGTLPLDQTDRMEFVRGAQSTLYGSDAMTSVIQVWTRTGSTRVPEFHFAADGGNFSTAHGYASLAGARGRFDYNLFGGQFNTDGSGINNAYSDSVEGANVGAALNDHSSLRVRLRHSNSHTGVPGEWSFNGYDPIVSNGGPSYPLPPNPYQASHLNSLLGDFELAVAAPSRWQHHFSGFDYLYRYDELNPGDPARVSPALGAIDFSSHEVDRINRLGFEYQGDYSERSWAHTTFGYRVENENGFVGDINFGQTHGQRLNDDFYLQQQVTRGRFVLIAGGRLVHDNAFGTTGVPRAVLTWQAWQGNNIFTGTRLRFSYATGFKEPRLEETFNGVPPDPFNIPNTALKPERSRSFEAGVQQDLFHSKAVFIATYFNNLFHDQINYVEVDPKNFVGEYVNVNKSLAHGAEVGLQAKLRPRLLLNFAYTYTSTQILDNPAPIDSQFNPGQPLLRRPKHAAAEMLSYLGSRWGANLGASFVGSRPDDDFFGFNIHHAAGYVRADVGGWYTVNSRVTTYVNIENALDRRYNEVVGYPALPVNFRAGVRFRLGGE